MRIHTRQIFDKSFTGLGIISIILMSLSLLILLLPVIVNGISAVFFTGTIEFRKMQFEVFGRGNSKVLSREIKLTNQYRKNIYQIANQFESELKKDHQLRKQYQQEYHELKKKLMQLLGPFPNSTKPILLRNQFGQTRWEMCEKKLKQLLYKEEWRYENSSSFGAKVFTPRVNDFKGTVLEKIFPYIEQNSEKMLMPKKTFYWRFFFDESHDAHFFGGIWPEILGTLYLTFGAILFAVPFGVIAAVYLIEFAPQNRIMFFLNICISTLSGVPSIVFGLFGLTFFINTIGISSSKSVLAGALTLAILILPTVIRASEEAIRAVPNNYKEAALSLGATPWYTVLTIILPSALPGILSGIVISMGRAAGETAPIIFTAAVSVGKPLKILELFNNPTPALSWNFYNLCTEHEAVDSIRHVQYGMVLTLIAIVLLLNFTAIIIKARIFQDSKK